MRRTVALLSLSVLGTGCAYAAIGFTLFARVPEPALFAWVFFAFGAAAGLCCTLLRMGRIHLAAQAAAAAAQDLAQAALQDAAVAAPPAVQSTPPAWMPPLRPAPVAAASAPPTRQPEPRVMAAAGFASSAFGAP